MPHTSYNRNDYLTECLVADSLKEAVLRPDGCWELPPVVMAVHAVNHIALHLNMGEKVPLKMLFVRQEGTRLSHILSKYHYIPRRPQEAAREILAKFNRVIRHRL